MASKYPLIITLVATGHSISGRGGREEVARTKLLCPGGTYPDKLLECFALPPRNIAPLHCGLEHGDGRHPTLAHWCPSTYMRRLVSISQLVSGDQALSVAEGWGLGFPPASGGGEKREERGDLD